MYRVSIRADVDPITGHPKPVWNGESRSDLVLSMVQTGMNVATIKSATDIVLNYDSSDEY